MNIDASCGEYAASARPRVLAETDARSVDMVDPYFRLPPRDRETNVENWSVGVLARRLLPSRVQARGRGGAAGGSGGDG